MNDCEKCGGIHFGERLGNCPLSPDYVPDEPWPKKPHRPSYAELESQVVELRASLREKEKHFETLNEGCKRALGYTAEQAIETVRELRETVERLTQELHILRAGNTK